MTDSSDYYAPSEGSAGKLPAGVIASPVQDVQAAAEWTTEELKMSKRADAKSLSRAISFVLCLGLGSVAWAAQSVQLRPQEKCSSPGVALISPEFVVIENPPQEVSFTISAQCLDESKRLFLVSDANTSLDLTISNVPKTPERVEALTATATLPSPGTYTVCVTDAKESKCGSQPSGPTVLSVSASACSDPAIPVSLAKLRSDTLIPDMEPPGIGERCHLDPAYADKAIMIDAGSGRTCTSTNAESPDDGCLSNKKPEKNPLQLRAGDTVRLYIIDKNPFLHDYKFASTDSQIKDDDIGTFLNVLVPGISGAAGAKGSGDKGGGTSTATAALTKEMTEAMESTKFALSSLKLEDLTVAENAVDNAKTQQREAHSALAAETRELYPAAIERHTIDSTLALADAKLNELDQQEANVPRKPTPKEKQQDVTQIAKTLNESLNLLQQAKAALPKEETSAAKAVHSCVSHLSERIDNLVTNYQYFARAYNRERTYLLSEERDCTQLSRTAEGLWRLISSEQAKILDSRLDFGLRDGIAAINAGMPPSDPAATDKPPSPDRKLLTADNKQITASFCTLKAIRKEISPVLSAAATGLESILINPHAFRSEILIGPYADATQFDWTLQRTMTKSPINGIDTAAFDAALDDCLSKGGDDGAPPEKQVPDKSGQKAGQKAPKATGSETHLRQHASLVNASFALSSSAREDAQDDSTSKTTNKNKKKTPPSADDSTAQKQKGPETPSDSSTTTRGRRINFGSERFIVSAGLTGTPISLQEFGKGVGQALDRNGKPIPGQETANIIILTTDQSYRLSPMLFLNSRAYQWNGRAEAVYATFGITAKSDSNGVAPEYLIGLSQGFLQRHLLLTAGAYAGRQQSLTGGLYVNEAIPSNLTGNIPTQSSYRMNAGFSISWRIPGLAK